METQKVERQAENPAYRDSRNGYKPKTLRSNYGSVEIQVSKDRNSNYEPWIVPKYSRDISEIDEKIIKMYARGMTKRQISE
ncbi:MAG: transposase [Eubacteriales bacterium]